MNSRAQGADLDLLYSDVEDALRESVRALLSSRCTAQQVTTVYDGGGPGGRLWRSLAVDLELAGLLVPEEHGGAGASAREAAVVLEELGRFVAPVPFLTSSVISVSAALAAGDGTVTARLASGEWTGALAVPLTTGPASFTPAVRVDADGTLRGRVAVVAGAIEADVLLVPAATAAGTELHLVMADDPGIRITPVVSLDMTRQVADLELSGAASRRLLDSSTGETAVRGALRLGAALLASEQVGVADSCLQLTVDYLRQRRQFGRVVAGFQAVKHRLADLWAQVESARAVARYAAAAAGDPDLPVAASLAQAYCSEVAVLAAEECVQLHGGIGMTWEYPAHLYLKRAKADQLALGNAAAHLTHLAELVNLPSG
ncbi:acyl-CoA dehydrogenase family protein [Acrocarpospora macrocephala]|uniref:Acyl-CoA dehydrogenase n=1 Tax=Acrocarpospora macrocephala TaxID=150177 RepID=A0A5M3WQA3_9ACTN|nr:acyl-CoA dehydrogenase family protein [Acrocarpospora macrocephala]GES09451.1 acyl-CoA dehydrogenase [Acrocarpospora macrocephala]